MVQSESICVTSGLDKTLLLSGLVVNTLVSVGVVFAVSDLLYVSIDDLYFNELTQVNKPNTEPLNDLK